jgi:hypothetical protein
MKPVELQLRLEITAAWAAVAGPVWLAGRLLDLSDSFSTFIGDLVRWRNRG